MAARVKRSRRRAVAKANIETPCERRRELDLPRRPANALNVEAIGPRFSRCTLKTPPNWPKGATATRWVMSGGGLEVFGICSSACPKRAIPAVLAAVEAGLVVHAEHPDFGGTLTIGRYSSALYTRFASIHHGGTCDVGYEDKEVIPVVRSFVFQIGERSSLAAAVHALDIAGQLEILDA